MLSASLWIMLTRCVVELLRVVFTIRQPSSRHIKKSVRWGDMARPDDEGPGSATHWVKSSLSFSNGNCVEVANLTAGGVAVRNSRDPEGPVLRFTPDEWHAFLGGAQLGEFDSFGR